MACLRLCGSVSRKASIVTFPGINDDGEYPSKQWMGDLALTSKKATLKRMVVPGSHDSASYSIPRHKLGSAIGKTQNLSIREQLLCGVRFLDLRIASNKNKSTKKSKSSSGVNIYHGFLMGCSFEEVLAEIRDFCNDYPTEFVILHVQAEHGRPFSASDRVLALNLIRSHFGSRSDPVDRRLLCKVHTRAQLIDTPLKDLIPTKGRVCVLLNPRIFQDGFEEGFVLNGIKYNEEHVKKEYGFHSARMWLRDKWHNTTDTLALMESNLREIRVHKANKRRYFVNNQFVFTPVFSTNQITKYVTGQATFLPVELAKRGLYNPSPGGSGIPLLHEILMEHPHEDWNLLSLDFVDLAPAALQLFIGMNFEPMEIELALLGNSTSRRSPEDVTDLVRSKILRGSCLFLHLKHDLDELESSLTLVYKIANKIYTIVVGLSEFRETHVLVLNQQNHIQAGAKEVNIGMGREGNGTIWSTRRSGVTVTWQKTESLELRFGFLDQDKTEKLVDGWGE